MAVCVPPRSRGRGPLDRARPGDRTLGDLLQRRGVRPTDGSSVEALHLAATPPARLRPVRVFPPDLPLRVDLEPRGVRAPRRLAPPATRRPPGRALLLLRRPLLDRSLRDRGAPARQLLARRLPRAAAREHARHHRRRGGRGLGAPPRIDARRPLAPRALQLEQGGPYLWRIPRDAERGMRGPGLGVADERPVAPLRGDAPLEQPAHRA